MSRESECKYCVISVSIAYIPPLFSHAILCPLLYNPHTSSLQSHPSTSPAPSTLCRPTPSATLSWWRSTASAGALQSSPAPSPNRLRPRRQPLPPPLPPLTLLLTPPLLPLLLRPTLKFQRKQRHRLLPCRLPPRNRIDARSPSLQPRAPTAWAAQSSTQSRRWMLSRVARTRCSLHGR